MGWKSITKAVTKPFKQAGKAIEKPFGSALNALTGVRDMRNAQREADARAAEEADNPIITPEATATTVQEVNADALNEQDAQARKRKRVGVSSSTSRGLTRLLGGSSTLG